MQRFCRKSRCLDRSHTLEWGISDIVGEIPKLPQRPWLEDEYEKFHSKFPDDCRSFLGLGWLLGLRRAQVETLNWAIDQGYPVTEGAVFRKPSDLPEKYYRDRDEPRVSYRRRESGLTDWRHEWREAMKASKRDLVAFVEDRPGYKPGLFLHGLRKNVVTRLLGLGIQPKIIMKLTGHRSLAMADHYTEPPWEDFAGAMAKVERAERDRRERRQRNLLDVARRVDVADRKFHKEETASQYQQYTKHPLAGVAKW